MYYERDSETQQRIDKISQILLTHPKLARTRGELAYLLLEKEDSFSEVKKHALQSMKDSDRETMPHLLLAYVALIEKNEKDCIKWISSAYKIAGKDDLLTYLRINEKLHILIVPTFKFLEEKKK